MGMYTPNKAKYDHLAEQFFVSRGYFACAIPKKAGRFADVVACNSENFAVIEVKSPNERTAWTTQVYRRRDYNLCGITRKEILERLRPMVQSNELGVAHLIGVTITNQLYCYYWDAIEKPDIYANVLSTHSKDCVHPSRLTVQAYLVVPVEWRSIVDSVLDYFRSECWSLGFSSEQVRDLCIIKVLYPQTSPVDLVSKA